MGNILFVVQTLAEELQWDVNWEYFICRFKLLNELVDELVEII